MSVNDLIDKYGFDDDNPKSVAVRREADMMTVERFNDYLDNYYNEIGIYRNRKYLQDFVKIQGNFNHQNYKKSYGCLFTPLSVDTIQPGMLGQLDNSWFDVVESIYLKVLNVMPEYENEFSKVFTLMGAMPDRLDVIPPSGQVSRAENELDVIPEEKFLTFLEEFVSMMFEDLYFIPDNFKFKISSSGNPGLPNVIKHKGSLIDKGTSSYIENSFKIFKKAQVINFNQTLKDNNFIERFRNGNLSEIFKRYGILFFYTDQHRSQPDKSTKERFVRTMDLWNPSFYNDHLWSDAVKKIDKDFSIKKYFNRGDFVGRIFADRFKVQCKKWRFVFAESASTNQPVNICLSALRKNLGTVYGNTFKCSDAGTVSKLLADYVNINHVDLRDYDILTFDVSNFDNNLSQHINISYCKGIERVSENLADFIFINSNAPGVTSIPYAKPDPRTIRNKYFFSGNSFNLSTFNMGVSPSGVADVSERAKFVNSAFVLYTYLTKFDKDKCRRVLKGEDKYFKFLNLGDNNFIIAHKKLNITDRLKNSKVFKVDLDDNNTFGGLNLNIDFAKNTITAFESPTSTLIKVLTPERPLDDPMRSSYALGTINRYELANSNWRTATVLDAIDEVMFNRYRSVSQLELAQKRLGDRSFDKSAIYEGLTKYLGENPLSCVSSYFLSILDSGGDKLFYTDVYDNLQDFEKEIVDELFFTVINDADVDYILQFFNLRRKN